MREPVTAIRSTLASSSAYAAVETVIADVETDAINPNFIAEANLDGLFIYVVLPNLIIFICTSFVITDVDRDTAISRLKRQSTNSLTIHFTMLIKVIKKVTTNINQRLKQI